MSPVELRNANVTFHYHFQLPVVLLGNGPYCHVELKKQLCCPVDIYTHIGARWGHIAYHVYTPSRPNNVQYC